MKNIHILPTDKPSRLSILNSGKLNFGVEIMSSSNSKPQHIYITSDEEIKEGDWCFDINENIVVQCLRTSSDSYWNKNCKKIILTTDQDLIKDGVQAIDDEFLEWFVKNPSCEEVEIEYWQTKGEWDLDYKIIIPREEPTMITDWLDEHGNPGITKMVEEQAAMFVAGFEECIKWQHSQNKGLYNEEDLRKAYIVGKHGGSTQTYYDFDEWFNQFKNKTQ